MTTDATPFRGDTLDGQSLRAYLQRFTALLHQQYERALRDLSAAQLYFVPSPTTNHIAFTTWHAVRTEDNVVQTRLQDTPPIWVSRGLDQTWGLPSDVTGFGAAGTGMSAAAAQALRLPSVDELLAHAHAVWAATDHYLATVPAADLQGPLVVSPFLAEFFGLPDGQLPVCDFLGQMLLAHGNQHLGEIWMVRELQGLAGIGV